MQIAPVSARRTAPSFLGLLAPLASPARHVQVAAHRGLHDGGAAYENTLTAFERALTAGADLLETDVQRTADGVLVLYHDAWIDGRSISQTRYADLPLLPNGERVATLQSLVDLAARRGSGARLLLETKGRGFEADMVAMVRARLQPGQYEFMSFDLDSVKALSQLAPEAKVGALFGLWPDWQSGTWPIAGAAIVSKARAAGADFVALDQTFLSDERVATVAASGLEIAVWTVDKRADMRRWLANAHVSRIITDHADEAVRLRDGVPTRQAEPQLLAAA